MANYLCTLRGEIAPATWTEMFLHTISVQSSLTSSVDVAIAVKASWETAWSSAPNPLSTYVSTSVRYTEATAAQIANLTEGDLNSAGHAFWATPLAGGAPGNMLAPQNAVAVSLTAGFRPNGQPIKGRYFLPPFGSSAMGSSGKLLTGANNDLALSSQKFLDALQNNLCTPCVWSRTLGLLSPVSQVRVGDQFDTVRRRRNKGNELYSPVLPVVR